MHNLFLFELSQKIFIFITKLILFIHLISSSRSINTALSFKISIEDFIRDAITGVPDAIASSGDIPNPHKLMDKKKSLQMKGTDLEDCHLNIQNICNFQYSEFYLKFHLHVCLSCQKLLKEIFFN